MKTMSLLLAGAALMLAGTLPARAQTGCVNSPENPTAILALVGSAGAMFASRRMRIK